MGFGLPLSSSNRAMAAFTSSLRTLPSTSSAEKIISSASKSISGWNSSQPLSSLGLYPSLAWLAAAAEEELL
jgi:CRISPR/Cas system-associated protein Cas10 (large subunit of type III CRISPR-Cas system)